MDLVGFKEDIFEKIKNDYAVQVLSHMNFINVDFIPVSALSGDNIIKKSKSMSWYKSSSLMKLLENAETKITDQNYFSMPIQYVNRPNLDFRGYCGNIASGTLNLKDEIKVSSSNQKAKVTNIMVGKEHLKHCSEGDSVTITLDKEIDISRGDIIFHNELKLQKNNAYLTNLIWLNEKKCYPNKKYLFKTANNQTTCELIKIKNSINVNDYQKIPAGVLEMNDIAECEILLDKEFAMLPYEENKTLGNFLLIDKSTNLTVAAGTIKHNLRRSTNITWQENDIDRSSRQNLLGQRSFVLWFTGLSGSGKSTIANLTERELSSQGKLTYLLDGDNLRYGLNKDLGFKKEDRIENLRRVGEVAKILHDAGTIVLASFISPYTKDRERIRKLFPESDFIEIYVKAKMESVRLRDPKGLYLKAEKGEIPNFTGIGSSYEEPQTPELTLNTDELEPEESVKVILDYLEKNNVIRN